MNKKTLKGILSNIKKSGFVFLNIYSCARDNEYIHSIYCTGKFAKDNKTNLSHTYIYYDKQKEFEVMINNLNDKSFYHFHFKSHKFANHERYTLKGFLQPEYTFRSFASIEDMEEDIAKDRHKHCGGDWYIGDRMVGDEWCCTFPPHNCFCDFDKYEEEQSKTRISLKYDKNKKYKNFYSAYLTATNLLSGEDSNISIYIGIYGYNYYLNRFSDPVEDNAYYYFLTEPCSNGKYVLDSNIAEDKKYATPMRIISVVDGHTEFNKNLYLAEREIFLKDPKKHNKTHADFINEFGEIVFVDFKFKYKVCFPYHMLKHNIDDSMYEKEIFERYKMFIKEDEHYAMMSGFSESIVGRSEVLMQSMMKKSFEAISYYITRLEEKTGISKGFIADCQQLVYGDAVDEVLYDYKHKPLTSDEFPMPEREYRTL